MSAVAGAEAEDAAGADITEGDDPNPDVSEVATAVGARSRLGSSLLSMSSAGITLSSRMAERFDDSETLRSRSDVASSVNEEVAEAASALKELEDEAEAVLSSALSAATYLVNYAS